MRLLPYTSIRVFPEVDEGAEVGAVQAAVWNLDNRHKSPEQSRDIVRSALGRAPQTTPVYMKVDSTLRGNVGAMVEAALMGGPYQRACLCPAFPQNGRTMVGSRLYVNQVPVEKTALASDPRNPLATGLVAALMKAQTALPLIPIGLDDLRAGRITIFLQSDTAIYVVDAAEPWDLMRIAAFLRDHPQLLPVGSAALAEALIRSEVTARRPPSPSTVVPAFTQIVALVGSTHSKSQDQVNRVATNPRWQIRRASATPPYYRNPIGRSHVILATPEHLVTNPGRILRQMAEMVADHLSHTDQAVVVATGGDTALALIRHLAVPWLDPVQELGPGVVLSHGPLGPRQLWLVTKSGAFGEDDFFERIGSRWPAVGVPQPALEER